MPGEESAALRSRIEAAAMLARLQTLHANIDQASGLASGRAGQSLAAIAAQIAGAESTISQALQSGGHLAVTDLVAFERLIQGSEAAAHAAELVAAAETTGKAVQELAAASAATRQEVQNLSRDLYDRHIFDRYLHFDSVGDEAEYHAREAERQRLIAGDLAHHTPDGNLNAAMREAGQMADAGTHGASVTPEFQARWQHLVETIRQQRDAMHARGKSTAESDQVLRDELRRSLHGVPPAQLERILASPDPLEAAGPYLNARQAAELEKTLPQTTDQQQQQPPLRDSASPPARITGGGSLMLEGLAMDDAVPADASHGLPEQARTPAARPTARSTPS